MLRKTDSLTAAARKFNSLIDELIHLCDIYYPDDPMLVIAKRKLAFSRKIDMLLPVQLTWSNRLFKNHGIAIINKDITYFMNTPHRNVSTFAKSRNDVTAADIDRLLNMFHVDWATRFDDELKDTLWKLTQDLYQAYLDYGFAVKQ
jgi:hypothetical protein